MVLPKSISLGLFWGLVGAAFTIGGLIGILIALNKMNDKVSTVILEIMGGMWIGDTIFLLVLGQFYPNRWVLIAVIIAFGIATPLLAIRFQVLRIPLILFIGAYLTVRAISWAIGGYPNEWTLGNLMKYSRTKVWEQFKYWQYYIYLAAIVVLLIGGMVMHKKATWFKQEYSKLMMKELMWTLCVQEVAKPNEEELTSKTN